MEKVQATLTSICPEDGAEAYAYNKEGKIINVMHTHLPSIYRSDLNRFFESHTREATARGIDMPTSNTSIDSWTNEQLPPFDKFRGVVIAIYHQQKSSFKDAPTSKHVLPLMFSGLANESGQSQNKEPVCYSCDIAGHRAGDNVCKKHGEIGTTAPEGWSPKRRASSSSSSSSASSSNGNKSTEVCRGFKNGYCRFGDNCRFKHAGGKSKQQTQMSMSKKEEKRITGNILNTLKQKITKDKAEKKKSKAKRNSIFESSSDDSDEEDSLSALMAISKEKGKKGKAKKKNRLFMMPMFPQLADNKCLSMLHSKNVVGIDTDASCFCSTNPQDFIPGLLNKSKKATENYSFLSAGSGTRKAIGVGPAAISTNQTEDGKPVFLISPVGVLLEKTGNQNGLTVLSQCHLRGLQVPLRQLHNGTDEDVLLCLRTNKTIRLDIENGIQVLMRGKRKATDLATAPNIKLLVDDIAKTKRSPIVDTNLKRYVPTPEATSHRTRANQVTTTQLATSFKRIESMAEDAFGESRESAKRMCVQLNVTPLDNVLLAFDDDPSAFTLLHPEPRFQWHARSVV
jgi:hypothetical protein